MIIKTITYIYKPTDTPDKQEAVYNIIELPRGCGIENAGQRIHLYLEHMAKVLLEMYKAETEGRKSNLTNL